MNSKRSCQFSILVLFLLMLSPTVQAMAIFKDSDGMPRCLRSNDGDDTLLFWRNAPYQRAVYGINLRLLREVNEAKPFLVDCDHWEALQISAAIFGWPQEITELMTEINGFSFNSYLLTAFEQIRHGGNVYRVEQSAIEYLLTHSLKNYDLATNKDSALSFNRDKYLAMVARLPKMEPAERGVVTGGAAVMPGMVELGEDIFLKPVRRGVPKYRGALSDMVSQPRAATVMGLLEEARVARLRGFKVAQKNGSMKTAFGRFKDFIVGNF